MAAANAHEVRMGTGTAEFNQKRSPRKGLQTPGYNALTSHVSLCHDDMALVPSMKAHTGGQGLGAASAPAAAVSLKKVALHRPHMADVLLAERMRIV